jgi:hypothetical protein
MTAKRRHSLFQISEIANGLIDPILAKRAGINTMLLAGWDEIAGPDLAEYSQPEKIAWQRHARHVEGEDTFRPGTLTVACEGARALFLSHAQDELIKRVNGFFGFSAIDRIRIVQRPISRHGERRPTITRLPDNEASRLDGMLAGVDDPRLKAALRKLGTGVLSRRPKSSP